MEYAQSFCPRRYTNLPAVELARKDCEKACDDLVLAFGLRVRRLQHGRGAFVRAADASVLGQALGSGIGPSKQEAERERTTLKLTLEQAPMEITHFGSGI